MDGDVPQPPPAVYMPTAESQATPSTLIAYDKLVLFELSANLYGSWGHCWRDAIRMPQHVEMLNLFLWILDRVCDCEITCYLETVVDSREDTVPPKAHSFRLWAPLRDKDVAHFTTHCSAALPVIPHEDERQMKRFRPAPVPEISSRNLSTKEKVRIALQAYNGMTPIAELLSDPLIGLNGHSATQTVPANHVLSLLDAQPHIARYQEVYSAGGVSSDQRRLSEYVHTADNGRTWSFCPPDSVRRGHLVRLIKPGFFNKGDEILLYNLPHLSPSPRQRQAMIDAVSHATGGVQIDSDLDPGRLQSTIEADDGVISDDILQRLLASVYTVLERVKANTARRLEASRFSVVMPEVVKELRTLFLLKIDGVPTVYHELKIEKETRLRSLRSNDACSKSETLAKRMFWRKANSRYTSWGNLFVSLIKGTVHAMKLLPPQRRVVVLLLCHSHATVANHIGANMYIVLCGPPETGKSAACLKWLKSQPTTLQTTSDGQSAKAYTAMDYEADLRIAFEDEQKAPTDPDDSRTKAWQTMISNGIIVTERLQPNPLGGFDKAKTVSCTRKLHATCTNHLDKMPPAMLSRATILALAANKDTRSASASTLASIGEMASSELESAFQTYCQALTCLQVDFWALEAAGLIKIDDRMVLLYKLISNEMNPRSQLSARKMVSIRSLATSMMVADLCSQWYCQGVGAPFDDDNDIRQARWYAQNAVIRMEHVVSAVNVSTGSTSVKSEMRAVVDTIRSMIRTTGQFHTPVVSEDNEYYVLAPLRPRFADDVASENIGLGPGLTKTILKSIQEGKTDGKPNIRYELNDRAETVLVSQKFLSEFVSAAEEQVMAGLNRKYLAGGGHYESWEGDWVVFKSRLREAITEHNQHIFPELNTIKERDLVVALHIIEARRVKDGSADLHPAWQFLNEADVAVKTESPTEMSVKWPDGTMRNRRTETHVLKLHRSMFSYGDRDEKLELQKQVFSACLKIAGGYENKTVVIGLGADSVKCASITPNSEPVTVTVTNPMFVPRGDLSDLLGEEEIPSDSIFPSNVYRMGLTELSKVEETCFEEARVRSA